MSDSVKIISPVVGSVYAERPIAKDAAVEAALTAARAALPKWRAKPIAERGRYMLAFLDALLSMDDDIATQPAWPMGRAVPHGGGKRRAGGANPRHRGARRGSASALLPAGKARLQALYRPRAARHHHGHRAVELSVSHLDQHHRAGAPCRQRRDLEACGADASRRRAHRRGVPPRKSAQGLIPQSRSVA